MLTNINALNDLIELNGFNNFDPFDEDYSFLIERILFVAQVLSSAL